MGNAAPGFTLNSQEGARVNLEEFRGKWVVLYFYPKDMTTGCTLEAHNFQRDLAQYDKRNAVIVGVSVDNLESHREFCTKRVSPSNCSPTRTTLPHRPMAPSRTSAKW